MRLKRLEGIVEELCESYYNDNKDLETPTGLGILTGTDFLKR